MRTPLASLRSVALKDHKNFTSRKNYGADCSSDETFRVAPPFSVSSCERMVLRGIGSRRVAHVRGERPGRGCVMSLVDKFEDRHGAGFYAQLRSGVGAASVSAFRFSSSRQWRSRPSSLASLCRSTRRAARRRRRPSPPMRAISPAASSPSDRLSLPDASLRLMNGARPGREPNRASDRSTSTVRPSRAVDRRSLFLRLVDRVLVIVIVMVMVMLFGAAGRSGLAAVRMSLLPALPSPRRHAHAWRRARRRPRRR